MTGSDSSLSEAEHAEAVETIGAAEEVLVPTVHADGSRGEVPIWIVRVDDELYVRSYRGPSAAWFRTAVDSAAVTVRIDERVWPVRAVQVGVMLRDEIDAAFTTKYAAVARDPRSLPGMVSDAAAATTLRFDLH